MIFWAVRDGIIKEDIPSAYIDSYKRVLYRLLTGLGSTTVSFDRMYVFVQEKSGNCHPSLWNNTSFVQ